MKDRSIAHHIGTALGYFIIILVCFISAAGAAVIVEYLYQLVGGL